MPLRAIDIGERPVFSYRSVFQLCFGRSNHHQADDKQYTGVGNFFHDQGFGYQT